MTYNLLCFTENTRLDQEESNGSNQGKDNHEHLLGLAYALKQTRRDKVANTVSYMTF